MEAAAPFLFRKEAVEDKDERIEATELPHLTPFALNLAKEVQSYLEQNVLSQLTSLPETKKEK